MTDLPLVTNWKDILKQAWSVKLASIAALLGGLGQSTAFIPPLLLNMTPGQMAFAGLALGALSALFSAGAVFARIVDQGLAPKAAP